MLYVDRRLNKYFNYSLRIVKVSLYRPKRIYLYRLNIASQLLRHSICHVIAFITS